MASAQAKPKLRVWLFKSFVTAGNDVLARHVEAWGKERNVEIEVDWATFGDREPKFVAAIEAGNPPDLAEMNIYGPMRYKAALRDVSKVATEVAGAKGGMLPFAEKATKVDGKSLAVPRYSMTTVFFLRKDIMEAKGLKPPKLYDPDVFITNVKLRTLPVGLSTFITGDVYGWGYLMAGAVLTTLPEIASYVYLQRYMVEGLTAGSVKG
jgi:ABC-type glycerol-3-phosphate transport system substrate-binding protein